MIYLNGVKIEVSDFPNNESNIADAVVNANINAENAIRMKYEGDKDLIHLMMVKRHLDERGVGDFVHLYLPYVPYSRMDRSKNGSIFTLKYIAEFINSLNFRSVTVFEAHSDVTPALINKCKHVLVNYDLLKTVEDQIGFDKENDYLFFPDAGAQKRYSDLVGYKTLVGAKKRDWETGEIKGLEIVGEIPEYKKGRKVIVVDDLCSYGGTFVRSSDLLNTAGFDKRYLIICHAEDSIFKGNLFKDDYFNKIFATDSMIDTSKVDFDTYKDKIEFFKVGEEV